MENKVKLMNFRFSASALEALQTEAERTGKSMTQVIEDLLLWRRVFVEDAETLLHDLAAKHKIPPRRVIECALLKLRKDGGRPVF